MTLTNRCHWIVIGSDFLIGASEGHNCPLQQCITRIERDLFAMSLAGATLPFINSSSPPTANAGANW